jgi:hypothetical protein
MNLGLSNMLSGSVCSLAVLRHPYREALFRPLFQREIQYLTCQTGPSQSADAQAGCSGHAAAVGRRLSKQTSPFARHRGNTQDRQREKKVHLHLSRSVQINSSIDTSDKGGIVCLVFALSPTLSLGFFF